MKNKLERLTSDFLTHDFIVAKLEAAVTSGCWDWNAALGDTVKEKYESLYCKLVELTYVLVTKGAKGYFWIVASPEVGSIFETAGFCPSNTEYGEQIPLGIPDIYELGTMSRKWKVFVDTNMQQEVILVGAGMNEEDPKYYGVLKIANFII